MEHNKTPTDKRIYIAIIAAIIALAIGATGLILSVVNSNKSDSKSPNTESAQPGGPPGPRDNPLYKSNGSSDSPGGGNEAQDELN